jgi:hypothetical protein
MRALLTLSVLLLLATTVGCATVRRDRCYLAETRFIAMKSIFKQTGSYQRVAQAMNDEGWAHCEINQFRYRLRKDLALEESQFDELFETAEPNREMLDFNPGRVEGGIR